MPPCFRRCTAVKPGSPTFTEARCGRRPRSSPAQAVTAASRAATSCPLIQRPVETLTGTPRTGQPYRRGRGADIGRRQRLLAVLVPKRGVQVHRPSAGRHRSRRELGRSERHGRVLVEAAPTVEAHLQSVVTYDTTITAPLGSAALLPTDRPASRTAAAQLFGSAGEIEGEVA